MIQVRKGVFETNSSSTHSICISREHVEPSDFIYFCLGNFGWDNDEVSAKDYLYTAIMTMDNWEEELDKLKSILDEYGVNYEFEEPELRYYNYGHGVEGYYLENGSIVHCCEVLPFVENVLNDEDLLMRLLFGNSFVYTGNDNCCENNPKCYAAKETIWEYYQDENGEFHVKDLPNPNHDEEHYEYFFKCN